MMKETRIIDWISILLMGLLLIMHFMPFWSYGGTNTSIQSYVWAPEDYPLLEEYFASRVDIGNAYMANSVVAMPILVFILSIVGIVMYVWKKDKIGVSIVPLVCSVVGIWGYLTNPVFRLGMNWGMHLAICVGLLIVTIIKIVFGFKKEK